MLNNNRHPLVEDTFTTHEDTIKDLNKFINKEKNILLVTGLSGSGKSTFAALLAKKYKCTLFTLDQLDFFMDEIITYSEVTDQPLKQFIKNNINTIDAIRMSDIDNEMRRNRLNFKYINYLINWCKSNPSSQYIIEGLQLYVYFDIDNPQKIFYDLPIVIKGTSAITSMVRATKRNANLYNVDTINDLKNRFEFTVDDDKKIEELVKFIHKIQA